MIISLCSTFYVCISTVITTLLVSLFVVDCYNNGTARPAASHSHSSYNSLRVPMPFLDYWSNCGLKAHIIYFLQLTVLCSWSWFRSALSFNNNIPNFSRVSRTKWFLLRWCMIVSISYVFFESLSYLLISSYRFMSQCCSFAAVPIDYWQSKPLKSCPYWINVWPNNCIIFACF